MLCFDAYTQVLRTSNQFFVVPFLEFLLTYNWQKYCNIWANSDLYFSFDIQNGRNCLTALLTQVAIWREIAWNVVVSLFENYAGNSWASCSRSRYPTSCSSSPGLAPPSSNFAAFLKIYKHVNSRYNTN